MHACRTLKIGDMPSNCHLRGGRGGGEMLFFLFSMRMGVEATAVLEGLKFKMLKFKKFKVKKSIKKFKFKKLKPLLCLKA